VLSLNSTYIAVVIAIHYKLCTNWTYVRSLKAEARYGDMEKRFVKNWTYVRSKEPIACISQIWKKN
jgi:hypothetical protein